MDKRQLLPDEFRELVEAMQDATHENVGTLTDHTGTHPDIGEIIIVSGSDQDAVLIHGGKRQQ